MNQAAILGGGVIGGGWAARFLLMGWDVVVHDPDPDAARRIEAVLANARRSLPGLYDAALPGEGTLRFANSIADAVARADWIQESVPERLETKHRVLAQVQEACPQAAVIASSTSGFKPSQLQQGAARPDQIVVAHPFNPVYLLPVVELVGHGPTCTRAAEILDALGMRPVHLKREIDAHVADRLLEAVWREALWLVKDDIATTAEIDDIMRYGFGLRWAQMGLFETYRVAGGEGGMAHFLEQFGPCLAAPWSKLTDVPDLDQRLIDKIAGQSDAQSGHRTIRDLERVRDDNLVAILRALKGRGSGAGTLLSEIDRRLQKDPALTDDPLITLDRTVPIDWTDYNGHMNESRYGQVFSDAGDTIMRMAGADGAYIADGLSFFTVDIQIKFLAETHAGEQFHVQTKVLEAAGKKLRMFHEMIHTDGRTLATGEQLLIHVNLETRRACEPRDDVAAAMARLPTQT
ncbi:carnitine 3-dehydrogenase [Actibacterium sp. 188UL27-1]|uniref:carnitine 3-dehydrogenase n=1 Tax=Actibacterium sp. 188UL27-1 TaxID=2786961 RepID=UPI00195E205F|nr:carnitine 3-dehydrogenase [Actibacterium sp. 188UL27-1]MBM7069220.1 carnitine 3-dehydrogenase [Actibacterium sp. 188UL27-1]